MPGSDRTGRAVAARFVHIVIAEELADEEDDAMREEEERMMDDEDAELTGVLPAAHAPRFCAQTYPPLSSGV